MYLFWFLVKIRESESFQFSKLLQKSKKKRSRRLHRNNCYRKKSQQFENKYLRFPKTIKPVFKNNSQLEITFRFSTGLKYIRIYYLKFFFVLKRKKKKRRKKLSVQSTYLSFFSFVCFLFLRAS